MLIEMFRSLIKITYLSGMSYNTWRFSDSKCGCAVWLIDFRRASREKVHYTVEEILDIFCNVTSEI